MQGSSVPLGRNHLSPSGGPLPSQKNDCHDMLSSCLVTVIEALLLSFYWKYLFFKFEVVTFFT